MLRLASALGAVSALAVLVVACGSGGDASSTRGAVGSGGASVGGGAGVGGRTAGGGAGSAGGASAGGSGAGGAPTGGSGAANGGGGTSRGGGANGGGAGTSVGGAGGTSPGGGSGSAGAPSGGSGSAGAPAGGGGAGVGCATDCALQGLTCCGGVCVNTGNDIHNCGTCGVDCPGPAPYCGSGTCGEPPCSAGACSGGTCCGGACCAPGQLCCDVTLGPTSTGCHDPVGGTCPVGCPLCDCASADTLVATPRGDVPIHALRVGDPVFAPAAGGVVPATVLETNRVPVANHVMVRVRLDTGAVVHMSPRHPTVDGKAFRDLAVGDALGPDRVVAVDVVPYPHAFTYDILTDGESGAYFADGALVGSTLRRPSPTLQGAFGRR